MKTLYLILFCLFIVALGCRSEVINPPTDYVPEDPESNLINFENPKAGQETWFLRYESICDSLDGKFHYTEDTLKLLVIEENGVLMLEECLTPYSRMYIDGTFREPIRQKIIDEEGRLLLPEREESALFYFYGNDTLHLKPQNKIPLYKVGCRIFTSQGPFIGNDIGEVDHFDFGDIELESKTVVSCLPEPLTMDAYLIYSENALFMSHTIVQGFRVVGWLKMEQD